MSLTSRCPNRKSKLDVLISFFRCEASSLTLESDCSKISYCGEKLTNIGYVFTSCKKTLEISYKSSNTNSYRGFNLYYEVTVLGNFLIISAIYAIKVELSYSEDAVSKNYKLDVCAGSETTIQCQNTVNTNFTVLANEALTAKKPDVANNCSYQ